MPLPIFSFFTQRWVVLKSAKSDWFDMESAIYYTAILVKHSAL